LKLESTSRLTRYFKKLDPIDESKDFKEVKNRSITSNSDKNMTTHFTFDYSEKKFGKPNFARILNSELLENIYNSIELK